MVIFFQRRHTYVVDKPIEQVQSKLKWIVTRRWDDFSMDIIGRMNQEGHFILTSKWALVPVRWVENRPGYINGSLIAEDDRTSIQIVTRPNRSLVFLFYLVLFLLGVELLNLDQVIPFERTYKLAFLSGLGLLLLVAIIFLKNRIRKRFEELMQLK